MCILLFLMAFGKGDVNRPGTGSFDTRQQRDTKARNGFSASPAASLSVRLGKRAASPTILLYGDVEDVDKLAKRIIESEMRVSIKSLFFQMYK